jgi:hypothetical protein
LRWWWCLTFLSFLKSDKRSMSSWSSHVDFRSFFLPGEFDVVNIFWECYLDVLLAFLCWCGSFRLNNLGGWSFSLCWVYRLLDWFQKLGSGRFFSSCFFFLTVKGRSSAISFQ